MDDLDHLLGMPTQEIDTGLKRLLVEQQLKLWRNTLENCRIEWHVAAALDDNQMKERIKNDATRCVKAIQALQNIDRELNAIGAVEQSKSGAPLVLRED